MARCGRKRRTRVYLDLARHAEEQARGFKTPSPFPRTVNPRTRRGARELEEEGRLAGAPRDLSRAVRAVRAVCRKAARRSAPGWADAYGAHDLLPSTRRRDLRGATRGAEADGIRHLRRTGANSRGHFPHRVIGRRWARSISRTSHFLRRGPAQPASGSGPRRRRVGSVAVNKSEAEGRQGDHPRCRMGKPYRWPGAGLEALLPARRHASLRSSMALRALHAPEHGTYIWSETRPCVQRRNGGNGTSIPGDVDLERLRRRGVGSGALGARSVRKRKHGIPMGSRVSCDGCGRRYDPALVASSHRRPRRGRDTRVPAVPARPDEEVSFFGDDRGIPRLQGKGLLGTRWCRTCCRGEATGCCCGTAGSRIVGYA
jgi:hypothetical protein